MKKKSIYQSLVVSNFVVLLVAIVVAIVSFQGYNRFSSAQAEDYNTVILRQIREAFDGKIDSINKLMLDVSFDPDVSSLHSTGKELTNLERYQSVKVMKSLDNYTRLYNNFIKSIALYYVPSLCPPLASICTAPSTSRKPSFQNGKAALFLPENFGHSLSPALFPERAYFEKTDASKRFTALW